MVDLNTDCRADLVILSTNGNNQIIEYWKTMPDPNAEGYGGRYCLSYVEQVTDYQVQSLNFVDVNFDGLLDMVLVVNENPAAGAVAEIQNVLINYNMYSGLGVDNLCVANSLAYPYQPVQLQRKTGV